MADDYEFHDMGDRPPKVKILTPAEQAALETTCARQARDARRSDRIGLMILSPAIVGCVIFTGMIGRQIWKELFNRGEKDERNKNIDRR